jgi:peptidoglycan/xylan/chitin deacetylase (PgdA/CDA1 family)
MSHGGVLTDLGEMGNWEALVNDQRREVVLWMRNNLAELTRASIYRVHQWWHPILRRCAGGRREGRFNGTGYRGIHWRVDSEDKQATNCDQRRRGYKAIAWQARVNDDYHRDGRAAT